MTVLILGSQGGAGFDRQTRQLIDPTGGAQEVDLAVRGVVEVGRHIRLTIGHFSPGFQELIDIDLTLKVSVNDPLPVIVAHVSPYQLGEVQDDNDQ